MSEKIIQLSSNDVERFVDRSKSALSKNLQFNMRASLRLQDVVEMILELGDFVLPF